MERTSKVRGRSIALLIVGVIIGGLLITPAGAHVGGTVGHVWNKHMLPLAKKAFYTKAQTDAKYLGKTAKAADANELDGLDSGAFGAADGAVSLLEPYGVYESDVALPLLSHTVSVPDSGSGAAQQVKVDARIDTAFSDCSAAAANCYLYAFLYDPATEEFSSGSFAQPPDAGYNIASMGDSWVFNATPGQHTYQLWVAIVDNDTAYDSSTWTVTGAMTSVTAPSSSAVVTSLSQPETNKLPRQLEELRSNARSAAKNS